MKYATSRILPTFRCDREVEMGCGGKRDFESILTGNRTGFGLIDEHMKAVRRKDGKRTGLDHEGSQVPGKNDFDFALIVVENAKIEWCRIGRHDGNLSDDGNLFRGEIEAGSDPVAVGCRE